MGHLSRVEVSHVDSNAMDAMPFWLTEPIMGRLCSRAGLQARSPERDPSFAVNENRFVEFSKIGQKMPLQPTGKMVLLWLFDHGEFKLYF